MVEIAYKALDIVNLGILHGGLIEALVSFVISGYSYIRRYIRVDHNGFYSSVYNVTGRRMDI